MVTYSGGFIIGLGNDETLFFEIKKAIEQIPGVRIIYCTVSTANNRLFIKKESELGGTGND